ncbi:MAG: DUF4292 domain-containing protein [Bacteroidetes bacterium]|nr:DUF4292 domain-containing protein [Bacteroidota bacterium]
MLLFLLTGIWLFSATACNTGKGISGENLKNRSARFLMKQLVEHQLDTEWFSAKAKIDYVDPYESISLTSYIRMRKDSVIWMNFKKLSVEAVRIQITPDSIYIIDRLNNEYSIKGFGFLQQQYQLPVTFESLQSLLLGNPVFFTTDLESEVVGQQHKLQGAGKRFANTYLLNGISYLLEGLILEDREKDRVVSTGLSDYRELGENGNFSYIRNITMAGDDRGEISVDMEFSKVEINVPKSIKFEIPDRYTRVD